MTVRTHERSGAGGAAARTAPPPVERIAIVGDAPLTAHCIDIAIDAGLIVSVVGTDDGHVTEHAERRGAVVIPHDADIAAALCERDVEALVAVAFDRALPEHVLRAVAVAVNFHDGPLPTYAGHDVASWALWNDETEHETTWHLMTDALDGGPIICTDRFAIMGDDTAFSLNARCFESALTTFPSVAAGLRSGTLRPQPQPPGERRSYRRHERPIAVVDPSRPADDLVRAVRSLALGHQVDNRLSAVHLVGPVGDVIVVAARAESDTRDRVPGDVDVDGGALRIVTVDGVLVADALERPDGREIDGAAALDRLGLRSGDALPDPSELVRRLTTIDPELAAHEDRWRARLADVPHAEIPALGESVDEPAVADRSLPAGTDGPAALAALAAWIVRTSGAETFAVDVTDGASRSEVSQLPQLLRPGAARFDLGADDRFEALTAMAARELTHVVDAGPFLADLVGRTTRWRGGRPPAVRLDVDVDLDADDGVDRSRSLDGPQLIVSLAAEGDRWRLHAEIPAATLERIADQLGELLSSGLASPSTPLGRLPIATTGDRRVIDAVNRTDRHVDETTTADRLVVAQVERTPDAPAVTAGSTTLTYRELLERADALATVLGRHGVSTGTRVGIAVGRSVDLVVSVLAVWRAGAAYVPLDPAYPLERLALMADDSDLRIVIADRGLGFGRDITVVAPTDTPRPDAPAPRGGRPDEPAYVIYTSGSTGVPKGVLLEHRNLVNFLAAMDDVIAPTGPVTWLAVTSLSFDISVLELVWPLTNGSHVVLQPDRIPTGSTQRAAPGVGNRSVEAPSMSLFYFAAGEATASDGYRLLLDSARWADANDFAAVWTPERHFHDFGGAYPNPSVTGAALAAVTERIAIRAGSVVAPLHAPARIAEEWAVVDNLSGGRVGISFAPGWQPNDFVLNPGAYAEARERLPEMIDAVRRLWRGEAVPMPGPDGTPVDVRTLPRPVQPELPVWLTSAGSAASFERAGRLGVNLLTHLLGQSIDQLAANIEVYRAAWDEAGHRGRGHVTLMLHTYLADSGPEARAEARSPLKAYLRTATGLIKNMASTFPTFARAGADADEAFRSMTELELDDLMEAAADRYLETSGLFGTIDDAVAMVERCAEVGVDEIACLIDFGVDTDRVLDMLPALGEVRDRVVTRTDDPTPATDRSVPSVADAASSVDAASLAALVERHGITHLQSTPSLATMLAADPADRRALATIHHVMLGGEALPTALAAELRDLLPGRLTNMYGPTETTIWSLVHEIDERPVGPVPIGRPIANTRIAVLDAHGEPVPIGTWGELHIGGLGVARGYHERPELTAERFADRPGIGRAYATGDVVRVRDDGVVEFAGRNDQQIKIRGHRVEAGEIEATLDRSPGVSASVVIADEGPLGDPVLVAFVVPEDGAVVDERSLRARLASSLPEAYVPGRVIEVERFPLTPNGKVDRRALAAGIDRDRTDTPAAPDLDDDAERTVAEIWVRHLGLAPDRDDNFFDIGGNSLLAVAVFRDIVTATGAELSLTDVFRYPTVRSFAAYVGRSSGASTDVEADEAPSTGTTRGELRRRARARRG